MTYDPELASRAMASTTSVDGRPAQVQGLTKRRWLVTFLDGAIPRSVILTDKEKSKRVQSAAIAQAKGREP